YPNGPDRNPNRLTTLPYRTRSGEPLVYRRTRVKFSRAGGISPACENLTRVRRSGRGKARTRRNSAAVRGRDADQVAVDGGGDPAAGTSRHDELLRARRGNVAGGIHSGVRGAAVAI